MEQINNAEQSFQPDIAKRVYKHYKPMAILYRKIVIGMAILMSVLVYCLVVTLKGNSTLQQQIRGKDVKIIMPNGGVLTR